MVSEELICCVTCGQQVFGNLMYFVLCWRCEMCNLSVPCKQPAHCCEQYHRHPPRVAWLIKVEWIKHFQQSIRRPLPPHHKDLRTDTTFHTNCFQAMEYQCAWSNRGMFCPFFINIDINSHCITAASSTDSYWDLLLCRRGLHTHSPWASSLWFH